MPREIIIILGCIILYWRTLSYSYVSDDVTVSKRMIDDKAYKDKDGKVHQVKNKWRKLWLQFIGTCYWKPLTPHLMVMILHIIICLLIYYAFGRNNLSFLTAILFMINPVNTQGGSIWLSGKIYAVSTALALLMFWCPLLAPGFYYLVKFFSMNALFAPLAFIATPWWFLSILPAVGIYFNRKILKIKSRAGTNNEMRTFSPRKLIPFIKSFGYYFILCIVPWRLALYHSFLWGLGVNKKYNEQAYTPDLSFFVGLLLLTSTIWLTIVNWGTPLSFGLIWFTVNIVMWCNFVTYQQQISERCVHTANVGLMLALASVIISNPILITIFITSYITRLWFIMPMYTNEFWHTHYSISEAPKCNYIWISRGIKSVHVQNFMGAYHDFIEARNCTSWEFKANFNSANMAIALGNFKMADILINEASKCPYDGSEELMIEKLNATKKFLEEVKKNGKVDFNKMQVIR